MKKALLLLLVMLCFALQGQGINMGKPSLSADNKRWDVWQTLALKGPLYGKRCYQIISPTLSTCITKPPQPYSPHLSFIDSLSV